MSVDYQVARLTDLIFWLMHNEPELFWIASDQNVLSGQLKAFS
jgi:hypothetical protein